jgi:hypothetical protein
MIKFAEGLLIARCRTLQQFLLCIRILHSWLDAYSTCLVDSG